jgi:hypothetical protein
MTEWNKLFPKPGFSTRKGTTPGVWFPTQLQSQPPLISNHRANVGSRIEVWIELE